MNMGFELDIKQVRRVVDCFNIKAFFFIDNVKDLVTFKDIFLFFLKFFYYYRKLMMDENDIY